MSIKVRAGYSSALGVSYLNGGLNFAIEIDELRQDKCILHLYTKIKNEPDLSIKFPKDGLYGRVHSLWVSGISDDFIAYTIQYGTKDIMDRNAVGVLNRESFGIGNLHDRVYFSLPNKTGFDWNEDRFPNLEGHRVILYKLHVRGFTRRLKSEASGTFKALIDKIPYLKSIGVNQVELMPSYEFDEVEYLNTYFGNYSKAGVLKPRKLINYWGYKRANYFAIKSAYSYSNAVSDEFKTLVREFHRNHMELIMELYFESDMPISSIIDVMKYYIIEYHVDGFHIASASYLNEKLENEPILYGRKLYIEYTGNKKNNIFNYHDGFLTDIRKYIKGDDFSLEPALKYFMLDYYNQVNYFAGHNGFTLADCFAYDRKHNEKNGFDNMDGTDYNLTWNCGKEGKTKSKKILDLRFKQIKNAMFLTLLSRGIPLIVAGDEMGKSQNGNNNTFCQDNSLSYVDWTDIEKNADLLEFFKKCTDFRLKHPILSCDKTRLVNKSKTGWPVLSFHSDKAWDFKVHSYDKSVGILYNGEYYRYEDNHSDELLYLGLNMHYEKVKLALPILPKEYEWEIILDSSDSCEVKNDSVFMPERTTAALVAKHRETNKRSKKKR